MRSASDEARREIDRVIDEANCAATKLLDRLDLTGEEREVAVQHAELLIRSATQTMEAAPHLRERVITAAYAFALCWLEHAYQLTHAAEKPGKRARRRKKRRRK